ncbi:hypothetical protein ACX80N_16805 [Arthrobacter sp. MDT2-16]
MSVDEGSDRVDSSGNDGESDIERRISALTDVKGNNLYLTRPGDTLAGYQSAQAAIGTNVDPAQCKDIAARNMGSVNQLAGEGSAGTGMADDLGTVLSAGLLETSSPATAGEDFTSTRELLQQCASFITAAATTTIDELPQSPIGDESYAVLVTQQLGSDNVQYTLSINARDENLLTSVQSVGNVKPDQVLQERLVDLAAQLLDSPAS